MSLILGWVVSLVAILTTYGHSGLDTNGGKIHEVAGLMFSAITVTILLGINRFLPVVKKALKSFYLDKEFLHDLSKEELLNIVEAVNEKGNNYKIEDGNRLKKSIIKAKKQAIKDNQPYFLHTAEISKVIYSKGLEMTIIKNKVEILKSGVFTMRHSMKTDNHTRDLPDFSEYLGEKNRFSDYCFKAQIFDFTPKQKSDRVPTFALSKLKGAPTNKTQEDILKKALEVNNESEKTILLSTNGKVKKGDTFTVEMCISVPLERVSGADKPSLKFKKPAGLRTICVQDDHFIPKEDVIHDSTLTINNEDVDDSKKIEESLFYKKIIWNLYYDEVEKYKVTEEFPIPEILLEIN